MNARGAWPCPNLLCQTMEALSLEEVWTEGRLGAKGELEEVRGEGGCVGGRIMVGI